MSDKDTQFNPVHAASFLAITMVTLVRLAIESVGGTLGRVAAKVVNRQRRWFRRWMTYDNRNDTVPNH